MAASFFVTLAAELLNWQNPAQRFSEVASFLSMGIYGKLTTQSSREISR
jgi:hypothetical protein